MQSLKPCFLLSSLVVVIPAFLATTCTYLYADEHEIGLHKEDERHAEGVSAEILKHANLSIERVGAAKISVRIKLLGSIVPLENKTAHLSARFSGIALEVRKKLGDAVREGDPLAVIESNQSLQPYTLVAPISGIITKLHVTKGELLADSVPLFEILDLSTVFAQLFAFPPDISRIQVGQRALISRVGKQQTAAVSYISPVTDETSRSRLVRVLLDNSTGIYSPGEFVSAEIVVEEAEVPLAVKASALLTINNEQIVFVKDGNKLQAKALVTARTDGEYAEIVSGLAAGTEYVAGDTFLLKAELGKGATDDDD